MANGNPTLPLFNPQESNASSSCSQTKLNLIGMGFSPDLVDEAIDKHGEENINLLLEALFAFSGHSLDDDASTLDGIIDSTNEDSQGDEDFKSIDAMPNTRSILLKMDFSAKDVDLALSRLGENASHAELVEFIIALHCSAVEDDQDCIGDGSTTNASCDSVTHQLLEMGFSEEEISMAINNFGPETPICELADSIFAKQIAYDDKAILSHSSVAELNSRSKTESRCAGIEIGLGSNASKMSLVCESKRSSWDADLHNPELLRQPKKGKSLCPRKCLNDKQIKEGKSLCPRHYLNDKQIKEPIFSKSRKFPNDLLNQHCEHDCGADLAPPNTGRAPIKSSVKAKPSHKYPSEPPYFLFGNVIDIPEQTWEKLSRFLYGVEPEFMNSQFFSALTRKEGFIHNLPTENRLHTFPGSPMTIQDALPFTKRWWPSWDCREKLNSVTTDIRDGHQNCRKIEKIIQSQGISYPEEQHGIMHQCKTLNLLWSDEYSLVPLSPENAELILGYPVKHTLVAGLDDTERLKALKQSFQTDVLGYLLSPLKSLYPEGLTVLSVFSGIGGAEVALAKLGIYLKCVVSIETSEINRNILKKWWDSTGQSGCLRQIKSIREVSSLQVGNLVREFGGFDLIIAGNSYAINKGRSESPVGVNFPLYFEFTRLFQIVRGMMSRVK